MSEFTVILSKCHFSSVGLINILTDISGNENIVSFSTLDEMFSWRNRLDESVSLTLYIIMPDVFINAQYFDRLMSYADRINKAAISGIMVIDGSESLPELFTSVCSCYGWQIISIYGMTCREIAGAMAHHGRPQKGHGRVDIVLTHREYLILGYLLRGVTVSEINKLLINVSIKTTYSFCMNLKRKLEIISTCKIYDFRSIINKAINHNVIRVK